MKFNKIMYFYPEKPVLSMMEVIEEFSNDPKWVCEPKYNGARCLVHILDGEVEFWDRHGKHLKYDSSYSEGKDKIIKTLRYAFGAKGYFVLDCELRHNKVMGIRDMLVIYDIHVHENELLTNLTFQERRNLLETKNLSIYNKDIVHLIYQYKDDFKTHFNSFIEGNYGDPDEFEGIVMKHLDGKLNLCRTSGKDSTWMFKIRKQTGRHRY